jgi:hypothetical protein
MDGEPADVHPQDRLGVAPRLLGVLGHLDPAGLAALSNRHLGLDDAWVADLGRRGDRIVDGGRMAPLGNRHAVLGEELLALVFEQVQERAQPIRTGRASRSLR